MSSRLSRSSLFAALAVVGVSACECDPQPQPPGGRPSLVARFPQGTSVQSDGSSRLQILLTAQSASRDPQTDPISITLPAGGGFLAPAGGDIVSGLTLTATPDDQGQLTFEYQCVPNAEASIALAASNADANTTINVSCTAPQGDILIEVDDSACDNLQADGQTTCTVGVTVSQDAAGIIIPKAGPLTVTVVSTVPAEAAGGDSRILAAEGGNVGVAEVTINADETGAAVFEVVSPTAPETATIELEFGGFVVTRELTIDPFDNQASITFTPTELNVTGGVPQTVEIEVVAANGLPASNRSLASIRIDGEAAGATVAVGALSGEEIADVVLDADGKASLTVTTPVVAGLTNFTVTVVFEALPNLDPLQATLGVTASEVGALLLNLTADPAFLKSDGAAAERTTDVTVQFSQAGGSVSNGTLTLTIPGDSLPLITFTNDPTQSEIVLLQADFGASGEAIVPIDVVADVTPGAARLIARGQDNDGNEIEEELRIEIQRDPVLQAIVFISVTPDDVPLGVQGGSLPSSAIVEFQLVDDQGTPMPNVPVAFRRNATAPLDVVIISGDISDATGTVTTVLSAGTQPGPVTVIAEALGRFGQSTPIPIVGGLPSFETSFLECVQTAVQAPYVVDCAATLVDRFSNNVDGVFVQFAAERGNEDAAVSTNGGTASVTITSSGLASQADLLGWSYAIVLPNTATDLVGNGIGFTAADADACFDASTSTVCDVVKLCNDADADILCPLPVGCLTDAAPALAVLADQPTVLEFASSAAERQRVTDYIAAHRTCGFPIGCFNGQRAGLALDVADGDECPVAAGCLDFTEATECPQDGVRTLMASTRGAEAFSDINGNGVFDFDDSDGDGVHDDGEAALDAFVDLPEPFLDRNDNCFRDDLTANERFGSRPILKVVNTDQFLDVSSNAVFGYDTATGLTDSNRVWDPDTQIFLTEKILEVDDASFTTGEKCTTAGANHTCDDTTVELCRETTGGNLASCAGTPLTLTATNTSTTVSFRFSDVNGNCPSPGFASVSAVTATGELTLTGDTEKLLSEDVCGFDELFNPILPFCTSMPSLKAPILTVTLSRNCAEDDLVPPGPTETKPATVDFKLDGTLFGSLTFDVNCPVAP